MGAVVALKVAPLEAAAQAPAPAQRSVLRFITCGSVDDGKSTLIGRVLYEAGAVYEDHLEALGKDSKKFGTAGEALDFALLVDGLAAEREQGITIDVAYRYFATPRRSFIVADTPGHEQYTRNMATGASTADLAILLVDARKGLLPQTRRHSFIVSTVGVKHVVVAINKMDLVGFDKAVFDRIEADYRAAVAGLGFETIVCIPVSAREGDNLTTLSTRTPWYKGGPLLPLLETIDVSTRDRAGEPFAMPVQWVNRPNADFRGFSGTIATGRVAVGETLAALPSRRESKVARIVTADGDLPEASAGQAVTITLEDEIDLSRGDVLAATEAVRATFRPRVRNEIFARVIVTGERTISVGDEFLVKLATASTGARVAAIEHAIDIETYAAGPAAHLRLNAIGVVRLRFDRPVVLTDYSASHDLGGFILIDRLSNETSVFGFVLPDAPGAAAADAPQGFGAQVSRRLVSLLGEAGSATRRERVTALSWRIVSAAIVCALVAILAGNALAGALAGLADIVLRPLGRRAHHALWTRFSAAPPVDLSLDGGGI